MRRGCLSIPRKPTNIGTRALLHTHISARIEHVCGSSLKMKIYELHAKSIIHFICQICILRFARPY